MILPKLAFCVLDISTPSLSQYQKLPTHTKLTNNPPSHVTVTTVRLIKLKTGEPVYAARLQDMGIAGSQAPCTPALSPPL